MNPTLPEIQITDIITNHEYVATVTNWLIDYQKGVKTNEPKS